MRGWHLGFVVSGLAVAVATASACSSFDAVSRPTSDDGGVDSDASADGASLADDGLALTPNTARLTLVPGRRGLLRVSLERGSKQMLPVRVRLSNAPAGVTAPDLTIDGTLGELEVTATSAVPTGDFDAVVEAEVIGGSDPHTTTTPGRFTVAPAPGTVDTTFGKSGVVGGLFSDCPTTIADVVVAPDGTVYVIGGCTTTHETRVAHLSVNGAPDPKYGSNGVASMGLTAPRRAALRATGELLVGGGLREDYPQTGRFTTAGAPDTTYSSNAPIGVKPVIGGVVNRGVTGLVVLASDAIASFDESNDEVSFDSKTRKLDVLGDYLTSYAPSNSATAVQVANGVGIAMAVPKGSPNLVFFGIAAIASGAGFTGRMTTGDTAAVVAGYGPAAPIPLAGVVVARQPGNVGPVELDDGSMLVPVPTTNGFYVVKVDTNGQPVSGFGASGVAGPFPNGPSRGITVAAGGIEIASAGSGSALGLVRLDMSGKLDPSYGAGGVVTKTIDMGSVPSALVAQGTFRVLAGVTHTKPDGTTEAAVVAFVP